MVRGAKNKHSMAGDDEFEKATSQMQRGIRMGFATPCKKNVKAELVASPAAGEKSAIVGGRLLAAEKILGQASVVGLKIMNQARDAHCKLQMFREDHEGEGDFSKYISTLVILNYS